MEPAPLPLVVEPVRDRPAHAADVESDVSLEDRRNRSEREARFFLLEE